MELRDWSDGSAVWRNRSVVAKVHHMSVHMLWLSKYRMGLRTAVMGNWIYRWILMRAINKTVEVIQWQGPWECQYCIRHWTFVGSTFSPPATSLSMLLRLICFHGSSVLFDSHFIFQSSLPLPFFLSTFALCFHLLSSFPPSVFTGHALLPSLWAWHSEVLDENPIGPQS